MSTKIFCLAKSRASGNPESSERISESNLRERLAFGIESQKQQWPQR
jgi:hypothetical protein